MKITTARIFQLLFLALFLCLFIGTDYRGKDEISVAVNSFFRADPFVVAAYLLSAKAFSFLLLPGVVTLAASILIGRFFCGWICPLGTIIDLFSGMIKKSTPLKFLKSSLKYYLLFILLFTALFNVNIAGILDPIGILVRACTFFFYPLLGHAVRSGWSSLYSIFGDSRDIAEPLYRFIRDYLLPFRETFYPLAFLSSILLLGILFLERFEERNWCKNLCPLGTLLGLASRLSFFRRVPGRLCGDCGKCRDICPTGFDEETFRTDDCILCMDCRMKCAYKRVHFPLRLPRWAKGTSNPAAAPVLERRVFVGGLLGGLFLSRFFTFQSPARAERLLRPPGVKSEKDFLKKCVRCGECMKVCLRSALYPDLSRAGLYGLFMPVLIPRLGYCEYNCNLCGQVCPTGAIPNLPLEEKKKSVIGLAVFDKNHCLPYAKKTDCIVCEEHCPIPEKAIRSEIVTEKRLHRQDGHPEKTLCRRRTLQRLRHL